MERTIWAAARRGDLVALRALLSPEAEVAVDVLDDFGVTALMVRARASRARRLSSHGQARSSRVLARASQHAATHGHEAAVALLLEAGASPKLQCRESGYTAVHRAFLGCKLASAAALVRAGASVHEPRDHEGQGPQRRTQPHVDPTRWCVAVPLPIHNS